MLILPTLLTPFLIMHIERICCNKTTHEQSVLICIGKVLRISVIITTTPSLKIKKKKMQFLEYSVFMKLANLY